MKAIITIAINNLLQAKRRTALLGTALFLISFLLVVLLAFSKGVSNTLLDNSTVMWTGHVNVGGFYKIRVTDASPMVTGAKKVKQLISDNVPEATNIIERFYGWTRIVSDKSSLNCALSGVDIKDEEFLLKKTSLAKESEYKKNGRDLVFGDLHALSEPNSIVIFAKQAEKLGVSVGDTVTLNAEIAGGVLNVLDVKIVAIAKDLGMGSSFLALVNKNVVKKIYNSGDDVTGAFFIYLKDITQANDIVTRLKMLFTKHNYALMDYDPNPYFMKFQTVSSEDWTGQRLDVNTWKEEVSYILWIVTAIDLICYSIVGIIAVVIFLGIFNTVWISVRERTSEIGTMRAIGMQKKQVMRLFLTESTLLALSFATLGALAGISLSLLLNALQIQIDSDAMRSILMGDILVLKPTFSHFLGCIIFCIFITNIGAFIPARKATTIEPATAIRR